MTITAIAKAQGPDIYARAANNTEVVVEVKTSVQDKPFEKLLQPGYGHKQCSDGWLKAVGVDPDSVRVLGVHIDMEKETVSIYQRANGDATQWTCLVRDKSLSAFKLY